MRGCVLREVVRNLAHEKLENRGVALVQRGGRCSNTDIALPISLSSVPLGLPLWAPLFAFPRS